MAVSAPLLAFALLLTAHSRSEGRSHFDIDDNGTVVVDVELVELDLPELCEVDLSLSQAPARAEEERRLGVCIERDFADWLRFSVDGTPCDLHGLGWRRGDRRAIHLSAKALCPPPAGKSLVVDWGFYAGGRLDHLSSSVITFADGSQRQTLLSKRKRRWSVEVPAPPPTALIAAVVAIAGVILIGVVAAVARRRRQRSQSGSHTGPHTGSHTQS